jgi:hypothetical protein
MGQMTEYGAKIAAALRAVRQMHSDCSRLLQDCDGTIGLKRKPLFGSYATRDLTWNYIAPQWMAEGVYRFYDAKSDSDPSLVEGVTIAFIDKMNPAQPEEPLLLVGQLRYKAGTQCKEWDLWHAFFELAGDRSLGTVLSARVPQHDRMESFRVMAKPLYLVTGMDTVVDMMAAVRSFQG